MSHRRVSMKAASSKNFHREMVPLFGIVMAESVRVASKTEMRTGGKNNLKACVMTVANFLLSRSASLMTST